MAPTIDAVNHKAVTPPTPSKEIEKVSSKSNYKTSKSM